MRKIRLTQPVIIYLLGMPGSGKTFLSHHLAEEFGLAHISSDRIRHNLFEKPKYDKQEDSIVKDIMDMMAEQFLKLNIGIIYDICSSRLTQRRKLREMARKFKASDLMIWLQIDPETAWQRSSNRDKRKTEDKFNNPLTQEEFQHLASQMQNPMNEDCLVISGKHSFQSHKVALQKRLIQMKLINPEELNPKIAKPELVNLVSKAQVNNGRVNMSRRNIMIR